jgi:hypothetical protein
VNQLIWRLHRSQVYFAAAGLAALAVLLVITGSTMAHDYHEFLRTCAATQSCADGQGQLFSGDGAIMDVVNLTVAIPLLLGLFWGAPLVAKELEDGTHNLVWTQGVTRRQWLRTNVIWVLLAAALWGAAIAALTSWWRTPENALGTRFDAFDVQGIVPVAYALFAVALGIAAGSFFRRVLPAIATTLGIFVALRIAIGIYVRPHFMKPLSRVFPLAGANSNPPAGSWSISEGIAAPNGHPLGRSLPLNGVPAACQPGASGDKSGVVNCLASHRFHQVITFQPGSRFWAFQGIEASIFVIAAAALIGLTFWRVLTSDA